MGEAADKEYEAGNATQRTYCNQQCWPRLGDDVSTWVTMMAGIRC